MHRRPILVLACAATLAALLAGCTGGSTSSPARTTSSSPALATTPRAAATKGSAPLPGSSDASGDSRVRDVSNRARAGFTSPSGHIACLFFTADDGSVLNCEINQKSWTPPPKPRNCHFDWAYGIMLESRASFYCGSDTIRGDHAAGTDGSVTLPYGSAMRFHTLTCTSQKTGVDCVNATTHHGFLLSDRHYQLRNR